MTIKDNTQQETPIYLLPLSKMPLSSQLRNFTGDTYNVYDFEMEDGQELNARGDSNLIHKATGLKFRIID